MPAFIVKMVSAYDCEMVLKALSNFLRNSHSLLYEQTPPNSDQKCAPNKLGYSKNDRNIMAHMEKMEASQHRPHIDCLLPEN